MGPPMPMPAAPKSPKADTPKIDMKPTKPKVDASVTPKVTSTPVTKRPKVTGKGTDMKSRNVTKEGPMGKRTLANVTADQLKAAGLTTGPKGLRTYLNMYDKLGKRPKPSDFKKKVKRTGSARPMSERKFMAGGMKSKMGTKGGAMGGKKKMPPGMKAGGLKMVEKDGKMVPFYAADGIGKMKAGGMKKPKGAAAGGGYKKGGMKTKTTTKKRVSKAKVRGAGIARKGVRPVKYR